MNRKVVGDKRKNGIKARFFAKERENLYIRVVKFFLTSFYIKQKEEKKYRFPFLFIASHYIFLLLKELIRIV